MIKKPKTDQIIAASLMELMGDISFEDISVQQIVNNCETSRQTFYKHFPDKYSLVCWIFREQVIESSQSVAADWSWAGAQVAKLNMFYENAQFYSKILRLEYFLDAFSQITSEFCSNLVTDRLEGKPFTQDMEFAVDFFSCGEVRKTAQWVTRGFRETPEKLTEYFENCIPESVRPYFLMERSEMGQRTAELIEQRMTRPTSSIPPVYDGITGINRKIKGVRKP